MESNIEALNGSKLIKQSRRASIQAFEDAMKKVDGAIVGDSKTCPLKHSFSDGGIYMREIFIPAGMLIVGKIHRHSHPNFLLKGEVLVMTEDGGEQRFQAPLAMISPAKTKRLIYALTDTYWITIHQVGEERDLEKIEDIVISKTYEELENSKEVLELIKEG